MSQLLFEENDLVYHYEYGEGLVVTDASEPWMKGRIGIKFKRRTDEFQINTDLVSFKPYTLEKGGFTQNPKDRTKCYNFKTYYTIQLERINL